MTPGGHLLCLFSLLFLPLLSRLSANYHVSTPPTPTPGFPPVSSGLSAQNRGGRGPPTPCAGPPGHAPTGSQAHAVRGAARGGLAVSPGACV